MEIDLKSDRIIWVCYPPGASGNSLSRVISMSPEIFWSDEEPDKDFNKTGRSHHKAILPFLYTGPPDPSIAEFQKWVDQNNAYSEDPPGLLDDHKICCPVHLPLPRIRKMFPRAKIVLIVEGDHRFAIRAGFQKVPDLLYISALPGREITSPVTAREDKKACIRASRFNGIRWQRNARQQRDSNRILRIYRGSIFGTETWEEEYLKICSYLEITPVVDRVEEYILPYISNQWTRKAL